MTVYFLLLSIFLLLGCPGTKATTTTTTTVDTPKRVTETTTSVLNGIWVLDTSASDSIDGVLKLMGVSYFKRSIASTMQITETFFVDESKSSVTMKKRSKYTKETTSNYLINTNQSKTHEILGDILVNVRVNENVLTVKTYNVERKEESESIYEVLQSNKNRMTLFLKYSVIHKSGSIVTSHATRFYDRTS